MFYNRQRLLLYFGLIAGANSQYFIYFPLNVCLCVVCLNVKHLVCVLWASMQRVQSSIRGPDVSTCVRVCPLAEGRDHRVSWCPVPVQSAGGVSAWSTEWFQSNVALQRYALRTLQLVCILDAMLCPEACLLTLRTLVFSANTTRIFEGSRIVKTGMVSGSAEL